MNVLAKNLIILASAGSGKTFQLGNRVIGLVAAGVNPEEIVALTFTRKAAGEFADSVLGKLADAARNASSASSLRNTLDLPDADFTTTLERVVRSLPRFTLTTIDAFFSRVVRAFQYELGVTGGTFELVEGPRATALTDEILAAVLGNTLSAEDGDAFRHAFRRASIGKESQGVLKTLRDYIGRWQERYQEQSSLQWGPDHLGGESPDAWEKHKSTLAEAVRRHLDQVVYTSPKQPEALRECIDLIEQHTIGSGSLGSKTPKLLGGILDAVSRGETELRVKSIKDFTINGPCATHLRSLVELAAMCELGAAIHRTHAIREVVAVYDAICEKRLRGRGLLGFHDVKILMGHWARDESARLRREAVDFRLDATSHHWLLDEFQDTSRADWLGLLPLVDEAATGEDGTMFIVGDRKQAIYAWRGGDVRLFDEVTDRYASGLDTLTMAESWRSCPEVLALVNRVCGDTATMRELFGQAADRWQWQEHYPAKPLAKPDRSGESRVEVVGKWDERLERLASLLDELGVGRKAMTCGVLLRGNEKARETAEYLRAHGFDVIEEGRRQPAADNPVGVFITHLIQWLANPSDDYSRETVRMSPLSTIILDQGGGYWMSAWEKLTAEVAASGFANTIEGLIENHLLGWSDFGQRRAGDLLAALEAIDHEGITSAREAAAWLQRMEVSQSPGIAAVQVMTIHKSKGLGFDLVVLPEIPSEVLPQSQYFDIAEGEGWITETPPKWARNIIPDIRAAEESWAAAQRYEGFCTLYVALTRAKRGLYVLLEPPAKSADPDKASLANWIRQSLGVGEETGVVFEKGTPSWIDSIPDFESENAPNTPPPPGTAIPRHARSTPTGKKAEHMERSSRRSNGIAFGTEVHFLLEHIRWADESPLFLPSTAPGRAVAALLENPALHEIFNRKGRNIELFTEQPIDLLENGILTSGVIDRLHIHRNEGDEPVQIHVIDYKTDAVEDLMRLISRYEPQMASYAQAIRRIYPNATICCSLISVHHCRLLDLKL
jgi:ATP-dependent exoDNAse (exonuclease V) beta subunit